MKISVIILTFFTVCKGYFNHFEKINSAKCLFRTPVQPLCLQSVSVAKDGGARELAHGCAIEREGMQT